MIEPKKILLFTVIKLKKCGLWYGLCGTERVIGGSDFGHIFILNKCTGKLVNVLEAVRHVVNSVQYPQNPGLSFHLIIKTKIVASN